MTTTAEDRARMKAYYRTHRDKLLAYNREYQKTYKRKKKLLSNEAKLKRSEYSRAYYARNRDKLLAYNREYQKTYRKKLLSNEAKLARSEYNRAYYANNKDKYKVAHKAWLEKHPGYMAEHAKKYRQQLKKLLSND